MKIFNSIREFINYIPVCILCQKTLIIYINGIKFIKPNWVCDEVNIKTSINDDGMITSINKNYPLVINPNNNTIIVGECLINTLSNLINLNKSCRTCNFTIKTSCVLGEKRRSNHFPSVILDKEELVYTKLQGKIVEIVKWRVDVPPNDVYLETHLKINNKKINSQIDLSSFFDLSKIKNLKQLNCKLSTLLTFQ